MAWFQDSNTTPIFKYSTEAQTLPYVLGMLLSGIYKNNCLPLDPTALPTLTKDESLR